MEHTIIENQKYEELISLAKTLTKEKEFLLFTRIEITDFFYKMLIQLFINEYDDRIQLRKTTKKGYFIYVSRESDEKHELQLSFFKDVPYIFTDYTGKLSEAEKTLLKAVKNLNEYGEELANVLRRI